MAEDVKTAETPGRQSATVADTQMRESLRGGLLEKLLHPDAAPGKPLFETKVEPDETKKESGDTKDKPGETKPDPSKTTVVGTGVRHDVSDSKPEEKQPATEETPKPKRKSKPAAPPPAPVDVQAVATAAASAAVQAQRELDQSRSQKTEAEEYPDDVKKQLSVYAELHRENPEKYTADLPKRMAKFVKEEQAYADKWEKENPGQTFDSEAEDHQDWYESNQPKIDKDDFEEARIAAKARKIIASEVEPKRQKLETEVEKGQLEPKLMAQAKAIGADILKSVAPFEGEMTGEVIEKVKEDDPIAFEVAANVDNFMAATVYNGGLLWNGMQDFNPGDQSHVMARQVLTEMEGELGKLDQGDLVRNGKPWVPVGRYMHMSATDQARYYTTEFGDLVNYIRHFAGPKMAKQVYEKRMSESKSLVEKMAPKLGFKKSEEGESSQKPPERSEQHERPSRVNPMIHSSPTVPTGTATPASDGRSNGKKGDVLDDFFSRLTGR